MDGSQQSEIKGGGSAEQHETSSPQDEFKHEPELLDLDEEAIGSPCPAPQSESELKTNTYKDEVYEKFQAATTEGGGDELRSILEEHPDFAFKNIGRMGDPPLLYIIRAAKKSEEVRLRLIHQIVMHPYRPEKTSPGTEKTTPGTGKTSRATSIVRHTGKTGRPALHIACEQSFLKIAGYLLQKGADINATDKDGNTALHWASQKGVLKSAEYLIKRGASINAKNAAGHTALMVAVRKLNEPMVNLLLRYKANPNVVAGIGKIRGGGRTALHKAAYQAGASKIVDLLLRADADIEQRNLFDETPLHDASRAGHELAVRRLLDEGAEVDPRTTRHSTPLHLAAQNGHTGTVELLLKFGASTASRNKQGYTPETLASKGNHHDVVEMLHQDELLRLSLFGRSYKSSKPNAEQKYLCGKFSGIVWPKIGDNPNFNLSVKEMLYESPEKGPLLKKLQNRSHATWIHLPANNMVWVEDVLKLIYQAPDPNTTAGSEQDNKGKGKAPSRNLLPKILQFIESHINETSQADHARQPHFRAAQGPKPRPREDHMISMVLPVVDTDMQQPHFYIPDRDKLSDIGNEAQGAKATPWPTRPHGPESTNEEEHRLLRVQEYTTSEGRFLTESENNHVKNMEDLEKAYRSIHFARTLDESFHEILDQKDLNERNGDQVVSRYLARLRAKWEEECSSQAARAVKDIHAHIGLKKRPPEDVAEEGEGDMLMRKKDGLLQNDRLQVTAARTGRGNASSGTAEQTKNVAKTPSELENQQEPTRTSRRSTIWGYIPDLPVITTPRAKKSDASNSLDTSGEVGLDRGEAQEDVDSISDGDEISEESEGEDDTQNLTPRQQILVVPQLWLWKIEDIIITAFPDRWDSSNSQTLPQRMLENLQRRASIKKYANNQSPDMNVHEVLSIIIETSLEFEPLFSVPDNQRSYHEAFAGEIAFVSGQVAHSYQRYRESLGRTAASFAQGVQRETEYLVMVDDILSELAMIRRVEQDQNLVGAGVMGHLRSRYEKQGRRKNPAPPATAGDGWIESLSPIEDTLNNVLYQTQNRAAKLDRQVEDAMRVRNSIITLLDLRQRQASTENALESGRQSKILFAQSKVLFIFTVATVIFAPLSWVSSLMAVKIDNFTPDAWGQAQAFAASFVSVMVTFLLCLLGWRLYDTLFLRDESSPGGKLAREKTPARSGTAEKDMEFGEKMSEQGRRFLETLPRKRARSDRLYG